MVRKKTVVRFDQFNHLPLIMNAAKQRYTCKNCTHHWTTTPYFVEKGHSISRHVILKIIDLLKEKISFTLIAKLCHMSITTVIRVLPSIKNYPPNPYQTEAMMIDRLLSYSEPLKEAYHCFHDLMDAFRSKKTRVIYSTIKRTT